MLELLLTAALTWPAHCLTIGELYHDAALVRDKGQPLAEVQALIQNDRVKRIVALVYDRKDMTPDQWRWFAIGVCVGGDERERGTKI